MENRQITVKAAGKTSFDLAIRLAFEYHSKAVGYSVEENTLFFYWWNYDKATQLPFEMEAEDAIKFAWAWFESTPVGTEEPDHDGSNGKGFIIYNDNSGHLLNVWQAIIGIKPIWAMYHK